MASPTPRDPSASDDATRIESLSAVTLATKDMAVAVRFYNSLGLRLLYGGKDADFTSFALGDSYLNLMRAQPDQHSAGWGRIILYVADVDAIYAKALALGAEPHFAPRDAEWGERYFHLTGPDGHELSFARPLE